MLEPKFVACVSLFSAILLAGCTPKTEPSAQAKPASAASSPQVAEHMSDLEELAPNAELKAGHVVFEGMVRPTKGGYDVRGVVIDDDALPKALAKSPEAAGQTADWFLGAVVRITGQLRKHDAEPAAGDGVVMQMRSGSWFQLAHLEAVTVVKPAEMIEGTLQRSKGLFSLAEKLISREDVAWSLGAQGGQEGDKVRFYGQSRTVKCHPNAQCLVDGSLPLFDVGRAERLR